MFQHRANMFRKYLTKATMFESIPNSSTMVYSRSTARKWQPERRAQADQRNFSPKREWVRTEHIRNIFAQQQVAGKYSRHILLYISRNVAVVGTDNKMYPTSKFCMRWWFDGVLLQMMLRLRRVLQRVHFILSLWYVFSGQNVRACCRFA